MIDLVLTYNVVNVVIHTTFKLRVSKTPDKLVIGNQAMVLGYTWKMLSRKIIIIDPHMAMVLVV